MDSLNLRQRILLNQPHIESVSGDIANFTTNMKSPLKECKIYFEPVQEGEGDPSPDNIRPISGWEGMNLNVNSINLWGGNITDSSSGKRLSGYGTTGGYPRLNKYINPNTYIISVICNLPNGVTQESWAKSYNIRTSFKSAIDGEWYDIASASTGELRPSTNSGSVLFTWTQLADISSTPTKFVSHPFKLTIPVSCIALGFYKYGNYLEYTSIQLEVGNTASDIESYNGTTIPISWANEVGTCYGGYLDLVNGELVGTYTYQTFDGDEPWSVYGSDVYRFALQPSNGFPKKKNGQNNVICDSYSAHGYNSNYYVALSGTQALYPTAQDLKDALSQNPIHACYELLEPVHYQLTPQQLLTFKGENNIWSNTNGQIEVKFWTY